MEKQKKISINNCWTKEEIYSSTKTSLKEIAEEAILKGISLRGADLKEANFKYANLRNADLWGTDLRKTNLSGANLENADLRNADLRGAILKGAMLCGAKLCLADLKNADLRGADLKNANLWGAIIDNADLNGANCLYRGESKIIGYLNDEEWNLIQEYRSKQINKIDTDTLNKKNDKIDTGTRNKKTKMIVKCFIISLIIALYIFRGFFFKDYIKSLVSDLGSHSNRKSSAHWKLKIIGKPAVEYLLPSAVYYGEEFIDCFGPYMPDVLNEIDPSWQNTKAAKKYVDKLLFSIASQKANITKEAWTLGRMGDKRAVTPLIQVLQDATEAIHAYESADLNDPVELKYLLELSKASAYSLGELGDKQALEPLIKMLDEKNESLRQYAILSLNKMWWKANKEIFFE